jgi:hypothetical protein
VLLLVAGLAVIELFRWASYRETWRTRIRGMWAVAGALLVAATVLAAASTEVAFRLAFSLNRSALEQIASEVKKDPSSWTGPRTVGVWTIDEVSVEGDGVAFHIKDSGGDNTERLMWSPVAPKDGPRFWNKPMGNDWYFQNNYH